MINNYEVYVAKSKDGVVLYVGQGVYGRHKHCLSGASHNKALNRYYFKNGEDGSMLVEVLFTNLSKENALSKEKELIFKLKPLFNVEYHNNFKKSKLIEFNSDDVGFETLMQYSNTYGKFFNDIGGHSVDVMLSKISEYADIAKRMVESGDVDRLVSLCGEDSVKNTPFIIKSDGKFVLNKASYNLFNTTPEKIKAFVR